MEYAAVLSLIVLMIVFMLHLTALMTVILKIAAGRAAFDRRFIFLLFSLPLYILPIKTFLGFWQLGANKIVDTSLLIASDLTRSGFWLWYVPYAGLILLAGLVYLMIWRLRY